MSRKYYIPITRSGSSILASIFTQYLDRNYPSTRRPSTRSQRFIFFVTFLVIFSLVRCNVPTAVGVFAAWAVVIANLIGFFDRQA